MLDVASPLALDRRAFVGARRTLVVGVLASVAAIAGAEALVAFGDLVAGLILHAVVLLALVSCYSAAGQAAPGERSQTEPAFLALALVPLMRIASLVGSFPEVSRMLWPVFAGIPVLAGSILVARVDGMRGALAWPVRASWRVQASAVAAAVPLSLLGYGLLHPDPLVRHAAWTRFAAAAAVLVVFTGVLEEVVFRGLLQHSLTLIVPRSAPLFTNVLFSAAFLGTRSVTFVGFAAVVGLLASAVVVRTRSLAGVSIGHGFLNVGLLLIWPSVFA